MIKNEAIILVKERGPCVERLPSLSCFGFRSPIFAFLVNLSGASVPLMLVGWSGYMSFEMILPSTLAIVLSICDDW